MSLTFDNFLDTVKYMSLNDIKNLCKTNKLYMNYCKEAKDIIFKDIVYVLTYYTFKFEDSENITTNVIGVYKNVDDAIKKMKELYLKQYTNLYDQSEEDSRYTFTYNEQKLSRELVEENFADDRIWKWKIDIKKLQ